MKWLSFVVPVYNVEKYLHQCVDSILLQPFDDIELILVDDGSGDRSSQICDEYKNKDSRVIVIHKCNEGVSKARAVGIDAACGEYIACVDSDDWISLDYCLNLKNVISSHNPDIVKYGYSVFNGEKNESTALEVCSGCYSKKSMIDRIYPITIENKDGVYIRNALWTCVIRNELLKKYCIRNKVVVGEDGASLKPCLLNANSLVIIDNCLYNYRIREDSVTSARLPLPWDGPQLIKEHYLNTLNCIDEDIIQQIDRNAIHNLFNVAVSQFRSDMPYRLIVTNVRSNLNNPFYVELLSNYVSKYDTLKIRMVHFALKRQLFLLMWLYSKVRK